MCNPREELSSFAEKELTANIQRLGLLEPIVVNSRTNRVVSGHQRLAIMDKLIGDKNYELTVAMVDLDEKAEKEQVIFLNNELAMGTFDVDSLQKKVEKGLDFTKCGFTERDLAAILPNWDPPGKPKRNKLTGQIEAPPHVVLVFRDRSQNDRFLQMLGLAESDKYLDGVPLLELAKRGADK